MLLILMLLILFKEVRVLANYPNTRDIGPGWSSIEFLDFVEGGGGWNKVINVLPIEYLQS